MALTITLAGLILAYSYTLFQDIYIKTEKGNLFHIAGLLQDEVETDIRKGKIHLRDLKPWVKKTGVRITVIQKDGMVLTDSERDASTMENHKDRPEIISAYKTGKGYSIRYSTTVHADLLYTALLLGSVDKPVGVLRVSRYLEKTETLTNALLSTLLIATSGILVIALLIMYFVTRQVTRPVGDLKNLEQIKKDLIANVSHELRTPLTAIKGYLETLEEDIPGDSSKYITILQRHTERMINIVQDLLILSELETEKKIDFSEGVDLCELIDDVANALGGKARSKELFLNIEKPEKEKIFIPGDSFRLEQAFINLVENAIKYTETGGITLKIEKDFKEAKISVSDTGSGIAEEHIPRVFERFYVVDKSRSRKLGGTGLGLSIVKHIVQLHKGRIHVESKINRGTVFTLFFKLKNNS
ncbi:MAG: ATP-binding protein [Leptospirales bacterium]